MNNNEQNENEEKEFELVEYSITFSDIPFIFILAMGSYAFSLWQNNSAAGFAVFCFLLFMRYY